MPSLAVENNALMHLRLYQMQVRLSYWPRHAHPPIELHWLMADSSGRQAGQAEDFLWTNRRSAGTGRLAGWLAGWLAGVIG